MDAGRGYGSQEPSGAGGGASSVLHSSQRTLRETLNNGRRCRVVVGRAVAPMHRMILVIAALAVAETAWALLCAETGANLLLFYVVLVGASAVLWIPGLAEKRSAR
jgi:hypothetical protein